MEKVLTKEFFLRALPPWAHYPQILYLLMACLPMWLAPVFFGLHGIVFTSFDEMRNQVEKLVQLGFLHNSNSSLPCSKAKNSLQHKVKAKMLIHRY